jgi:predicted permease
MGANTAIFSLIDAVLLRSLPVRDPGNLYFLNSAGSREVGGSPPYPCFERFRSQAKSLAGVAAYDGIDFGIRIDGRLEQVDGARVSGDYYNVLGLTPFAGRLLTPDDEKLDPPVAVISYAYWQRRFGGTPDAIGKTFTQDDRRFTIAGITPKEFHGVAPGQSEDVTMPITIGGPAVLSNTGLWWFQCVARLKTGVPVEQAHAEIDSIFQAFMSEYPASAEMRRDYFHNMVLSPASHGMAELRKRFSRPLWALMAVVGLVLLIACANITNLLLARAAKREREFEVRVAIGAGRARLFRQLLVETGLLFVAGTVAGLAIAWWAARGVTSFFTSGAHPIVLEVLWDWRVAAFAVGLCLLATFLFGAAPILRVMQDCTRSTASRGRFELGRILVAFQVALSVILLAGAALFLRTLNNLYKLDAGYRADQIGLMLIHLPDPFYHAPASRIAFWDRMLAEVRRMPRVRAAGLSATTPLDGKFRGGFLEAPGFQPPSEEDRKIGMNAVSEDYFRTLGTPVLRGRDFRERDRAGAPNVAMLNESAARHFFPGRDPIGASVKFRDRECRIVGLVRDTRQADLRHEAGRFLYIPARQPFDQNAFMTLSVRTTADPQSLLAGIEQQVRGLGPDIHIVRTGTLAGQRDESLLQERLISTLATAFGILALVLSAVGLYGVLAYSVARRTSEIGLRMALGALPGDVVWSVLRQTLWLVGIGLAAGIPASIFLAKLVRSLLYGVTPTDALAQVSAAALLAAVAVAASYLPARRAGRIDPMIALRYE